jgi:glycolate oxidase
MAELLRELQEILSERDVLTGDQISDDYSHDECLNVAPVRPSFVVRPNSAEQVARILKLANQHRIPVTVRGAGSGLSGGCIPDADGIVLSTARLKKIEIDTENHVAVVEPGVTLGELDEATAPHGLCYPIQPGEASATLGGNVATNAGGMRAVKYGVTRNQVLGMQFVLPSGEIIESGGKFVKASSGYDLSQLVLGSEGTLAVVTRIIVKLVPRLSHRVTLLAPFPNVEAITRTVPKVVQSGAGPLFVEYLDALAMASACRRKNVDLGLPPEIVNTAHAYMLIVVEGAVGARVQEDAERLGEICVEHGALDVMMLPASKAKLVIDGREESFWSGKEAGMCDQLDVVVPRASLAVFMAGVQKIADATQTFITGTGHAGDGNVHLGIFQPDAQKHAAALDQIFDLGQGLGGVVSAEHGIGLAKKKYFQKREDPAKLALLRRIKQAFDPNGIMNPGRVFDLEA